MAQVLAAHGTNGEMKCRVVTDFPERFKVGSRVYAGDPPRPHRITGVRGSDQAFFLRLQGVTTRELAQTWQGRDLLVPRSQAVSLPEGEFFWSDVIGLRVEDESGAELGTVAEILETGANHVYVVRGERGEILVPAIKDVVKLIDPPSGRIVVEPLPGQIPEPRAPRPRRRFVRRSH